MSPGWAVWITGLPGSGKSVVARTLKQKLSKEDIQSQIISSDQLRTILTPDPTYSEDERNMLYQSLICIVNSLTKYGANVIIDATGNKRKYRDDCRAKVKHFFEVYLKCPLEICIQRESSRKETHMAPKNIYLKAKRSEDNTVPGLGDPYEPPKKPELQIDSNILSPEDIAQIITEYIQKTPI